MKTRKGFTLIELMIVIAIISIIAAIAIPNLMQSRIRANEATAVTAIKNYATAQVQFQVGRHGSDGASPPAGTNGATSAAGYTAAYQWLFFGTALGRTDNLALISMAHANAYITTASISDANYASPAIAYQGYFFDQPGDVADPTTFYDQDFAQIAYPANADTTGNNAFWVGIQGTVYAHGTVSGTTEADADGITTPTTDYAGWRGM